MEAQLYSHTKAFARVARPFYAADPVLHTTALTALDNVEREGTATVMAAIETDGDVRGVVLSEGSWPLAVSGLPTGCAQPMARALARAATRAPAAMGPADRVDAFAAAWTAVAGTTTGVERPMLLYRLGELRPPADMSGELRVLGDAGAENGARTAGNVVRDSAGTAAGDGTAELVARWRLAFKAETMPTAPADPDPLDTVRALVTAGDTIGVWTVAGEPVSTATMKRPGAGMTRIGYVYTPPEHRGRGYAAAVTAALSLRARRAGIPHVVLYTDTGNPVSNGIYQRLGYRLVAPFREVTFVDR